MESNLAKYKIPLVEIDIERPKVAKYNITLFF